MANQKKVDSSKQKDNKNISKKSAVSKSVGKKVTANKTTVKNTNKKTTSNKNNTKKSNKNTSSKKVPKFSTISNVKTDSESKNEVSVKNKTTKKNLKVKDSKQKKNKEFKILNVIPKITLKKNDTSKKVKKNETKKVSNLFKGFNKWFIIIIIICVLILIFEGIYFVTNRNRINNRYTYYDTINSLAFDDSDSGVVTVGSSDFKYSSQYDYTNGVEKGKLVKYDKFGKIMLEKMYDNGINTTFSSVISVEDGYIVVGSGQFSEEEVEKEAREAIIIKYDKDGNIVWQKYYQVITNTKFNKVIEVSDGYIAIGQSIYANLEMGNHTTGGGIIVKYDKQGNEVWHNNHGGTKSGNFNDIVEVNGNLYVVGKDAYDSGNLIKYNRDGVYQWHKNYGYTDTLGLTGITYLNNTLYVVGSKKILPSDLGEDDSRDTTNTDAVMIFYDLDGNLKKEKLFGGTGLDRYNSIISYANNLYVVGHLTSTDAGLKVNTDGKLMTGFVVRYDIDGNILKKEVYGGSNNDNLTDIVTDGVSLYISGYSNSKDGNIKATKHNGKDYFGKLIKLDFKFRKLFVR